MSSINPPLPMTMCPVLGWLVQDTRNYEYRELLDIKSALKNPSPHEQQRVLTNLNDDWKAAQYHLYRVALSVTLVVACVFTSILPIVPASICLLVEWVEGAYAYTNLERVFTAVRTIENQKFS